MAPLGWPRISLQARLPRLSSYGIFRRIESRCVASLRQQFGSQVVAWARRHLEIRHLLRLPMKAAVTEKLLRSLLSKGEPYEPIWDQIPPEIEWRIGQRKITGSIVGRVRGSGERERRFGAIAEQFIRHLAEARTARAIELRIRRELIARWGDRPITKIARAEVANMVVEIAERGHREAARQTFIYARRLFRWAVARGLLEHAPTDYLNAKDLIGAKRVRQRLLTERELRLIWR